MRTRNNLSLTWIVPAVLLLLLGTSVLALASPEASSATPANTPTAEQSTNQDMAAPNPMTETHAAPANDIHVAEVAVCRKVEDRTPVDPQDSFASDVQSLYCFTDVRDAGSPQRIFHRWYVGDHLVCEVPMEVQGTRWRCWSEKTIAPGWTGPCHVEIVNEAGDVIGQTSFSLVADATPSMNAQPDDSRMQESSTAPQDPANPQ